MIKKICFVIPGWVTKKTGGSEWQLYNLSNKFIEEGWNVEIVTTKKPIIHSEYINSNIKYIYYQQSYFKLSSTIAFFVLFAKLFFTSSKYYYVRTDARIERAAVRLYSKLRNKKYIYALAHDDDAKNLSFKERNRSHSKYVVKRILSNIDTFFADLLSKKINATDLIIVQNTFQQDYLKKHFHLSSVLIRNSYFGMYANESIKKENMVLWVANMRQFKNPLKFLEIVKKLPDSEFQFTMIGECREYCNEMNHFSQKNFTYVGPLNYEETMQYFSKARLIINTSHKEGFSNTFLQAWANKVWLITMGVDPDNMIKTNDIGDVCENTDEIVVKLSDIEKNGANEEKLLKAQNFVKNNFSIEHNYKQLIKHISQLT